MFLSNDKSSTAYTLLFLELLKNKYTGNIGNVALCD